jgi:hypothetical protein
MNFLLGLSLQIKAIIVAVVFAVSIFGTWNFTASYKDGQYAKEKLELANQALLEQQQQEEIIQEQAEIILKKQQSLAALNGKLEKKYADQQKEIDLKLAKFSSMLDDGFRLYDPGKTKNSVSTSATNGSPGAASSSNRASSSGELSRESTAFLLKFASDADKVVAQLKTSQEYAKKIRQMCMSTDENDKVK